MLQKLWESQSLNLLLELWWKKHLMQEKQLVPWYQRGKYNL